MLTEFGKALFREKLDDKGFTEKQISDIIEILEEIEEM